MSTAAARKPIPVVPSVVLATAAYVASAVMLFGGLVSVHLVARAGSPWPPPGLPRLPLAATAANLCVLLASGWAVRRALRACPPRRWLGVAASLGTIFFAVQGAEWLWAMRVGLDRASSAAAASHTAIVGAHGLHVLGGLALLATTARLRDIARSRLVACSLYWAFVVILWPGLYALLYLG